MLWYLLLETKGEVNQEVNQVEERQLAEVLMALCHEDTLCVLICCAPDFTIF